MKFRNGFNNAHLLNLLDDRSTRKEDAFTYLYQHFEQPILQYVRNRGGKGDDGRELFQETMVIFYECYLKGRVTAELDTIGYVWGIARHLWFRKVSREARVPLIADHEEEVNAQVVDVIDEVQEEESGRNILLTLFRKALSEPMQDILKLAFFERYSNEVIAERLGKTERTVKTQKCQAISQLRQYLEENPNEAMLLTFQYFPQ